MSFFIESLAFLIAVIGLVYFSFLTYYTVKEPPSELLDETMLDINTRMARAVDEKKYNIMFACAIAFSFFAIAISILLV